MSKAPNMLPTVVVCAEKDSPVAAMAAQLPDKSFSCCLVETCSNGNPLDGFIDTMCVVFDAACVAHKEQNEFPALSPDYIASGGPVVLVGNDATLQSSALFAALSVSRVVDVNHGADALYGAVCREIEDYRLRLSVREAVKRGKSDIGSIESASFRFRTREEAKNLATMLSSACNEPVPIAIGLTELFLNAVEHGCLGIGHSEKGELIEKGRLSEEILYRRSLPEYADRYVSVEFNRKADQVSFLITDPGEGFDHAAFVQDTEGHQKKHGRGITMAGGCFDELTYLGKGNCVRAVHRLVKTA